MLPPRAPCLYLLQLGRPNVPVPPAPPLPAGVSLVTSGPGQSCDAACVGKQMACMASAFASLNDCNSLRSKFLCEAGAHPLRPEACHRAGTGGMGCGWLGMSGWEGTAGLKLAWLGTAGCVAQLAAVWL